MKLIRKISIGSDYKDNAMQEVYGGHKITDIIEKDGDYEVYIEKDGETKPWKSFNRNMAISIEYNLSY